MTVFELAEEMRQKVKEELNPWLIERGVKPFKNFGEDPLEVDETPGMVTCYLAGDAGATFQESAGVGSVRFVIGWNYTDKVSKKNEREAERLFSAIVGWAVHSSFAEVSTVEESRLLRVSEGYPFYGGALLIASRIYARSDQF